MGEHRKPDDENQNNQQRTPRPDPRQRHDSQREEISNPGSGSRRKPK